MALTPVWFPILPAVTPAARPAPIARVAFVDEPFSPTLSPNVSTLSARTEAHTAIVALPAMTPFAPLPVPINAWQTIYILPIPKRKEW